MSLISLSPSRLKKIQVNLKHIFLALFLLKGPFFCGAQEYIYVDAAPNVASISLQIKKELNFPDISVQVGKNIPFEDFTVGITQFKSRANFVIAEAEHAASRVVKLDNCDNLPDLSIKYGVDIVFPDVRIEFRENGMADYLIYTENLLISTEELLVCLLPLIRQKAQK